MGISGVLAAEQLSFELLCKCLGGQWWSPQVNTEVLSPATLTFLQYYKKQSVDCDVTHRKIITDWRSTLMS